MEFLAEIIGYLPPNIRTIVVLMLVMLPMAAFALGIFRALRGYRLPWVASSDFLMAAMVWLVFASVIVVALVATLVLIYYGAIFLIEIADALSQTAQ